MPAPVENLIIAALALLQWVGPILLIAASAKIGIWLLERWNEFKHSQPENIQNLLTTAVELAIDFAEKIDAAGLLEEYATTKKEAAKDFVRNWLRVQGFYSEAIDQHVEAVIDGLIEALLKRREDAWESF